MKEDIKRAGKTSVLDLDRDEAKRRKMRRRGKRIGGLLEKPMRKSHILEWEGSCPYSYHQEEEHSFLSGYRDLAGLSDGLANREGGSV